MSKLYKVFETLSRYENGEQLHEDCITTSNIGDKSIGTAKKFKRKKNIIQNRKEPK